MDTLFIPGWLITVVIVAILVLILLVKGMSMLNPTKSWSLPVFGSNVTCVGKQAL